MAELNNMTGVLNPSSSPVLRPTTFPSSSAWDNLEKLESQPRRDTTEISNATIAWEREKEAAATANKFAAEQAQLNREFQERMSSTAYQRVMKDLKSAGLNPILAAQSGSASQPAGATAQPSKSSAQAAHSYDDERIDLLGTVISSALRLVGTALFIKYGRGAKFLK